jgi:parvulin-like peptidyl-prolyl isomerase
MTRFRLTLAALGATSLLLLASACGGGAGDVPDGFIAVVDGTEISEAELDALVDRARKGYEAADREFPKVGTPEFQSLQTQFVEYLVQREEFEQAAEDLDVTVSEKDKDKAVEDFVKSRFDGKRAEYLKALKEQGYTEEDFRETLAVSVLAGKIYEKVTKDVKVSEPDILAYYTQNQTQYRTPESRDVRHILIAEKKANDQVDFAKSKAEADRIFAELRGGADFAALAKESSADPGSKDSGGKLTISRGQTVPQFDKVAFDLEQGAISRPVKTTYGYHVIEALSPVRKAKVTSLDDARPQIRATLLSQKKQEVMTKWVEDLRDDYEDKVSYAEGYAPPELPDPETTTTENENQ